MERIAICPGSFDPITKGHQEIILRARKLFDRVMSWSARIQTSIRSFRWRSGLG